MTLEYDDIEYNGRRFDRLTIDVEPSDTPQTLFAAIGAWLDETNAVYFRVDMRRPGHDEVQVVVDGAFQLNCFVKGLKMAMVAGAPA